MPMSRSVLFLPGACKVPVQDVLLCLVPLRIILLRDRHGAVPERLAYFPDVHSGLEQFHAEGMPEHVRGPINTSSFENLPVHFVERRNRALRSRLPADKEKRG